MAKKHFSYLIAEHDKSQGYTVIGFDGKKSEVNMPKNQVEYGVDKVVVVDMEQHKYITHYTPENAKGITNALCLYEVVKKYDSLLTLRGVAADGPPNNKGYKEGAIRLLETFLGRPLQWQICALHLNELNMKHMFIKLGNHFRFINTFYLLIAPLIFWSLVFIVLIFF